MPKNIHLLVLTLCFYSLSCSTFNINNYKDGYLPATALQPFGRYVLNQEQQLELVSSAVHFGVNFEGADCQLFASIRDITGHNYIQYELDGVSEANSGGWKCERANPDNRTNRRQTYRLGV